MKRLRLIACAGLLAVSPGSSAATGSDPWTRAHAHNDYEHARPLLDALDQGFGSVEADVWLVDGRLLVAHDRKDVRPDRTLAALYLDPLRERARQNGGRLSPDGLSLTLLVDVKTEAVGTYSALRVLLRSYTNMLTAFTATNTVANAVTVLVSGNRAAGEMAAEALRFAALDGRLPDLDSNPSPHLVPLISDNWALQFRWRGAGWFAPEERERLGRWVEQAHRQGRRIRFWAAPDTREAWHELHAAGVDLINTDDLAGLSGWLRDRGSRP